MGISLEKRAETAQGAMISLLKESLDKGVDVGDVTAACRLVIDFSGSMAGRYSRGDVQDLAERVLACALAGLDDDGDIQVDYFHHDLAGDQELSLKNYSGAVQQFTSRNRMGGTSYAPVIRKVIKEVTEEPSGGFFRKKKAVTSSGPAAMPTLVFFITDGEPGDKEETIKLVAEASDKPIFWQFLGLGYEPAFLKQLDNMSGRTVDNANLAKSSLENADDQVWFTEMLREFIQQWIPAARAAQIIQ